jgi:hypothetical protein
VLSTLPHGLVKRLDGIDKIYTKIYYENPIVKPILDASGNPMLGTAEQFFCPLFQLSFTTCTKNIYRRQPECEPGSVPSYPDPDCMKNGNAKLVLNAVQVNPVLNGAGQPMLSSAADRNCPLVEMFWRECEPGKECKDNKIGPFLRNECVGGKSKPQDKLTKPSKTYRVINFVQVNPFLGPDKAQVIGTEAQFRCPLVILKWRECGTDKKCVDTTKGPYIENECYKIASSKPKAG